MFPRVHPATAEEFLIYLSQSCNGSAELMLGAIRRYFRPERVRYFITSAVGFYLDSNGRFDKEDFQNVIWDNDGATRIRNGIHPINVIEPVLWLSEHLAEPE